MATVKYFLNKFVEAAHAEQYTLMDAFRRYLITTCWRKLVSCTIQWSYSGMLYHLYEISHEQVKLAFIEHHASCSNAFSKLNDGLLLDEMDAFFYDDETMIQFLMSSYPSLLPRFTALEVKYLRARLRKEKQLKEGMTLYDGTTCFEFHQLLIAAFVAIAKKLSQLNKTPQTEPVVRATLFTSIFCFASFIWGLTESRAIQVHLAILEKAQLLHLPDVCDFSKFEGFTRDCGYNCFLSTRKLSGRRFVNAGGETLTANAETLADPETLRTAVDAQIQTEAAEAENESTPAEKDDLGTTYQRQLASVMTHFGASSILGRYSQSRKGSPRLFDVMVIQVQKPKGQLCKDGYDTMMKNIFPDTDERDRATTAIFDISKQMMKSPISASVCIGGDLQYILNSPHKIAYGATAHCEILLTTFLKYREIFKDDFDNNLRLLIEV